MGRNGLRARNVVIAVLLILLISGGSFLFGFYSGVRTTIDAGLDLARRFVTIDVNSDLVYSALFQYKQQIGSCYPYLNGTKVLSLGAA